MNKWPYAYGPTSLRAKKNMTNNNDIEKMWHFRANFYKICLKEDLKKINNLPSKIVLYLSSFIVR